MQKVILTLLVLAAAPTAVQAFDLTGGEVKLGYSTLTGDGDFAKTSLQGALEMGFTPRFGMQVDLGLNAFSGIGKTATTATLHGIYHLTEKTSLGLFYDQDHLSGENVGFYGFEAGQNAANFDGEAFVAVGEDGGISTRLIGVSGRYTLSDTFGLGGSLQRANLEDGVAITRLGVKADMELGQAAGAFVELGTLSGGLDGASGSETFVGIGANFKFGAGHGVTFGKRGVFELLPGL